MSEFEMETQQVDELEDQRLTGSSFLDQLNEFLDSEEIKELNIDNVETFSIKNMEQANYFIKKVLDARSEQDNINNIAEQEIAKTTTKITTWRDKENRKRQNDIDFITNLLRTYAEAELAISKKKTINLPYGSIGFKKVADKFEYDEAALLSFLQESETLKEKYIKLKPSPDKVQLKKDGESIKGDFYIGDTKIAGITVTPQEQKFEVK